MTHRRRILAGAVASATLSYAAILRAQSTRLEVGPTRRFRTIGDAANHARDGDEIVVDAGDYRRDVAVWTQHRLRVRSNGGRVRLIADGASAESKAIWVVRARQMDVRGFDFLGCRVPDRNGAGIRLESGSLAVRDCIFLNNENGLLTGNEHDTTLRIEDSEFGFNGHGDGQSHNLYAGQIASLSVSGCYFHHALVGHLLKSRAATSRIVYSRLSDEADGRASYELEFPNGGVALVMGCVVQQGPLTENPVMISYGAEGYSPWPRHRLELIHNTLLDRLPRGGVTLRVAPGSTGSVATDNLLVGASRLDDAAPGRFERNFTLDWRDLANAEQGDLRLLSGAGMICTPASDAMNQGPVPEREYVHPRSTRALDQFPCLPGAFQSVVRSRE